MTTCWGMLVKDPKQGLAAIAPRPGCDHRPQGEGVRGAGGRPATRRTPPSSSPTWRYRVGATPRSVPVVTGSRSGRCSADTASGRNAFSLAPGNGTGEPGGGVGAGEHRTKERVIRTVLPLTVRGLSDRRHRGAGHGVAGHPSRGVRAEGCAGRVEVTLPGQHASPAPGCPVKLDRRAGAYVLKADLVKVNIERRRRAEATEDGGGMT